MLKKQSKSTKKKKQKYEIPYASGNLINGSQSHHDPAVEMSR